MAKISIVRNVKSHYSTIKHKIQSLNEKFIPEKDR
jgi:hypothetical protein